VSHNMGIVTSLCPTAIWLDSGSIREYGAAREVITQYQSRRESYRDRIVQLDSVVRPGPYDGRIHLESVEWLSELPLRHGEPVQARIRFSTQAPVSAVSVGIGFSSPGGVRLLSYDTDFQDSFRPDLSGPGKFTVKVAVDALPLGPDIYDLDIGCRSGDFHGLDYIPACAQMEVIAGPNTPGTIVRKGAGVRLRSEWSWDSVAGASHVTFSCVKVGPNN
jgi:lipopolysaccharide transport system ATP-binding protein